MTLLNAGEHFMAQEVEWDPTGRYVATIVNAGAWACAGAARQGRAALGRAGSSGAWLAGCVQGGACGAAGRTATAVG